MDRVEIFVKRLKELRQGSGLNDPALSLAPEDPLCIALKVPKRWRNDMRSRRVKESLTRWVHRIDNPRWREAVCVAYGIHPDYEEIAPLHKRRGEYAKSVSFDPKTVERDEGEGIKWLAERLAKEPKLYIPGRKFVIAPNGEAIPKFAMLYIRTLWSLCILVLILWLANKIGLFYVVFYIVPGPLWH